MFKDNKKIKIIAIIEAVLIVILTVPLVIFTMTTNTAINIVPTINTEPDVKTKADSSPKEIVYQQEVPTIEKVADIIPENSVNTEISENTEIPTTTAIVTQKSAKNDEYSLYKDKDMETSINGIDVSEYQGFIDWKQVKDSGIDFAFIRIGCRTYADGGIIYDTRFKENLYSADRAGIHTGVYFFSQALTTEEAIEEADAVIEAIRPFNITYPVVFDWEIIYEDYARTDEISIDSLADCCVAFCERVKEAGYTPMIYQNTSTLLSKVDLPRVKEYDIWLAEYNDEPTYYYDFKIWQYASDGRVPGIATDVDMNVSFKDYSK